jgi:hypothetical protein
VEIQERVRVEPDILSTINKEFDSRLVVQDHLGFAAVFAFGLFAEFDEVFCIEPRVRVPFEATRSPGEIDEQPIEYRSCVRASRSLAFFDRSECAKTISNVLSQVERLSWTIGLEKPSLVACRLSLLYRPSDTRSNVFPRLRHRHVDFPRDAFISSVVVLSRYTRTIDPRASLPLRCDSIGVDEVFQTTLESTAAD